MNTDKLIKDLVVLRNYHLGGVKKCDELLEELRSSSPTPSKKAMEKAAKKAQINNYILSRKWGSKAV